MASMKKVSDFIGRHKLGVVATLSATATLVISVSISFSVVSNIKSDYESKYTKSVIETLRNDKTITESQLTDIVRKISATSTSQTAINNVQNNESRRVDFSSVKYSFTDEDKTKITDYIVSYLNYYKQLQSENDARLNKIYDDKSFYERWDADWKKEGNEGLIKYFEQKRSEYRAEIERMQRVLFEFYHITIE
jgi:hypothetical protein